MAKAERTRIFTRDILELQQSLEKGKDEFLKVFRENNGRLHNCSVGDSYLSQALIKVCYQAIEKFIFN